MRGLTIEGVHVSYGGQVALTGASMTAPMGMITGLIGPNGAGKTTLFNVCSGLVRASSGRVSLNDLDLTTSTPAQRARAGLGRTFQRVEVCNAMDVRTNVSLGLEARLAGASLVGQITASRRQRHRIDQATDAALEACGIGELATDAVAALSTGQRRLVELARVLAGGFDLILLDEPSSGLDDEETKRFGSILQQVVDRRGVGIVLVEHDMNLVMAVCERIFVLDFGHIVFDGPPAAVRQSDIVRDAYLGQAAHAT